MTQKVSSLDKLYRLNFNQSGQTERQKDKSPDFLNKTNPKVLVVDSFDSDSIDINGDGVNDINHGKLVARIIKSMIPGAKLEHENIEKNDSNIYKRIANTLDRIASKVDCKKENVSAVVMSLGTKEVYKLEDYCKPVLLIDPDYLKAFKARTISILSKKNEGLKKVFNGIKALVDKKIPVYIAGGNCSFNNFNPFNCVEGVISIGATDSKGNIEYYSNKSPLISKYEQGCFNVKTTEKDGEIVGYDVLGKKKPDISTKEVRFYPFLVNTLNNQKANMVDNIVETENDTYDIYSLNEIFRGIKAFYNHTYKNDKAHYKKLPRERYDLIEAMKIKGKYLLVNQENCFIPRENTVIDDEKFTFDPLKVIPQILDYETGLLKGEIVDIDTNGIVKQNPDGTGSDFISYISGASFATPIALSNDIKK